MLFGLGGLHSKTIKIKPAEDDFYKEKGGGNAFKGRLSSLRKLSDPDPYRRAVNKKAKKNLTQKQKHPQPLSLYSTAKIERPTPCKISSFSLFFYSIRSQFRPLHAYGR